MAETKLKMYGTTWCGDCARSKRLLDRLKVPFSFINIDQDADAREYVVRVNRGNRSVPTIVFPDGSVLVEPSDQQLEEKIKASKMA
jgi:mycoredoxin